jgi:hypothetical protein
MPATEGMVKSTGSSIFGSVERPYKGSVLAVGREPQFSKMAQLAS